MWHAHQSSGLLLLRQPRLSHNLSDHKPAGKQKTMRGARALRTTCAAAIAACSLSAGAGTFNTVAFGLAKGSDIRDQVPDAFTKRYPSDKWSVFLFTEAGMTSGGTPYCFAIAGVSPKGSDKFPINRYTHFIQSQDHEVLTAAKKRAWAIDCARNAVENMMTDDLETLYEPDAPPAAGKRP
jgi:hypothetical protein